MVPMLRTIAYRVPLMLAIYKIANHNTTMTREIDPVQEEVFRRNPDWMTVAQRIAEQPGHEDFPTADVKRILDKPGELIISTLERREGVFAMGAIIAAKDNPFAAAVDEKGKIRALRIDSASKDSSFGSRMRAEREIAFWTELQPDSGVSTWMGAGIQRDSITLANNAPRLDLAVGADEVNEYFRVLAERPDVQEVKPRIIGSLFQVARLAMDFDAPVPTTPRSLEPELVQAIDYYMSAQRRAQTVIEAKAALDAMVEGIENQGAILTPAIHYDRPLDMPSLSSVREARRAILYPTQQEALKALSSYDVVLNTLDIIRPI